MFAEIGLEGICSEKGQSEHFTAARTAHWSRSRAMSGGELEIGLGREKGSCR